LAYGNVKVYSVVVLTKSGESVPTLPLNRTQIIYRIRGCNISRNHVRFR
jgi:hypothetical protein